MLKLPVIDPIARKGFTLAELLIALAILGIIAVFTIPKVLQDQSDLRKKAAAKEVASMISGAYEALKRDQTVTSTTNPSHLTSYMNYVSIVTSEADERPGLTNAQCSSGTTCLQLHNGGTLFFRAHSFNGTASTSAVWFGFDPDGTYSGQTTGPGKGVKFWLYYNGRMVSFGNITDNTCNSQTCYTGDPSYDPEWFSWD